MSFASEMKKELTQIESNEINLKAELSAMIRMNGSLSLTNRQFSLDVQTENAAIARRMYTIMKQLYDYKIDYSFVKRCV